MPFGALNPNGQVYQASGESTPSAKLPEKYVSTTAAESPISDHMAIPSGFLTSGNSMVVQRQERTVGMRYLYTRGLDRQPIQRLGADGQPYPHTSGFQPQVMQKIGNAGFNDALFQAGYPGFNLGLSFKVPTLPQNAESQNKGRPAGFRGVNINVTAAVNRLGRATVPPRER